VSVVRRLLLVLAAGLALVSWAAGAPAKQGAPLYGFLEGSGPDPIARLDPGTLRPVGKPLAVGAFKSVWAYSPDRARIALAWSYTPTVGRPAAIRIVDLRGWRTERMIELGGRLGQARALTWNAGRLLLLVDAGDLYELVAVDVDRGRVVASRSVADSVVRVVAGAGRLALLVGPTRAIGPARLVVVDTALRTTTVRLDRVTAGQFWDRPVAADQPVGHIRIPGLVVDPAWRTAFVLSADEAPAAVDLRTHTIVYGSVRALARAAKEADGPWRFGLWTGPGGLVFGGVDHEGRAMSSIGVSLVGTEAWTPHVLDARASAAVVGGGVILTWDALPGVDRTPGLKAFTTTGEPLWPALPGSPVGYAEVSGGRALVRLSGTVAKVVDLRTGEVVGTLRASIPQLLVGRAAAW
jgi:hypothetical protein